MTSELYGPALLFVPADRPDRYQKAADRSDTVIIDLEDAVAPQDKDSARRSMLENRLDPARTIVRVNAVNTEWFQDDMAAMRQTDYTMLMLPKAETASDIERLEGFDVIAVCETALGVHNAGEIAGAENTFGLIAGVEDLFASMGGSSTQWANTKYRDTARYARSAVLIAARAMGKHGIDTVYLNISDLAGLKRESDDAAASGFTATACIHPAQVATIRTSFTPNPGEVAWARAVLEASEGNHGVFSFAGRMVDSPVLRHAESILRRDSLTVNRKS